MTDWGNKHSGRKNSRFDFKYGKVKVSKIIQLNQHKIGVASDEQKRNGEWVEGANYEGHLINVWTGNENYDWDLTALIIFVILIKTRVCNSQIRLRITLSLFYEIFNECEQRVGSSPVDGWGLLV